MWKYALQLIEERLIDNNVSQLCIQLVIKCINKLNLKTNSSNSNSNLNVTPISSTMLNIICNNDNNFITNISKDFAEICLNANQILIAEILNDIGSMNISDKSKIKNLLKNLNIFIIKLGEIAPELVCNLISLIIDHMDSEAYLMRYIYTYIYVNYMYIYIHIYI